MSLTNVWCYCSSIISGTVFNVEFYARDIRVPERAFYVFTSLVKQVLNVSILSKSNHVVKRLLFHYLTLGPNQVVIIELYFIYGFLLVLCLVISLLIMFPYELTVFTHAWFLCELLGAVECRERQG